MASIYDKASLVLIPSGTKTSKVYSQKPVNGDGDFTFSRSTAATRVNADGNIEKETQNLLKRSNNFTSLWGVGAGVTRTSGQAGYDGTNDAWEFDKTAANAYVYQPTSTSGVNTFSVYLKAGTLNWARLQAIDAGNNPNAFFDLQNGVVGVTQGSNYVDSSIESIGSGWYRCKLVFSQGTTQVRIYPADADGVVSGTSGSIYAQDAQLEQGLVARDYIETTTAAVEGGITDNVPRLDYTDSSCPALLLEPERTNVLTNSEYGFSNTNSIITYNATTSPEGLQNAFKLTENTAAGNHRADTNFNADADTYTFSVFAKAGERNYINFAASNVGAFSSTFNLTTGVLEGITGGTGSIQDYGNGWYRLIVTKTISSAGGVAVRIGTATSSATQAAGNTQNYTGDGVSGLYLYGYMVERGSYATSYIPTYGSAVTRNADSCSKTGVSDLIGQSEGTLFVEYNSNITSDDSFFIVADDGTANNRIVLYSNVPNKLALVVNTGGVLQVVIANITLANGINKFAVGYANNDVVLYLNGTQVGSDNTALIPATSALRMSTDHAGSDYASGKGTKQYLVFKTRLSNEELATLTTI